MKIIKEKNKYYEANKEKIKEANKKKRTCECGCEVNKVNLTRHKKSQLHLDFLKQTE